MWNELPVSDNFDLPIGNNYFPLDCNVIITDIYLNILKQDINVYLYLVTVPGDFNVPNYGLVPSSPQFLLLNRIKEIQLMLQPAFLVLISVINTTLIELVF
jgi:hypothetical protein